MNKRVLLALGLIVLSSGIIAALILTRGHNWGDDFAAYILQARSLIDGHMDDFVQRSAFTIEESSWRFGPVIFPWGLPILLAPIYAIFGVSLLAFKLLLTLCYMAFLIAFFFLARTRHTDTESLLLTAFMAFNLRMFQAQNEILSDLPFLLWSTLTLVLVERYLAQSAAAPRNSVCLVGIGLTIFMAAFTRPNGSLLFVPLAVAQLIRLGQRAPEGHGASGEVFETLVPYMVFGICYGMQAVLLPNSAVGLTDQWETLSWGSVWQNLKFYFLLPGDFLRDSKIGGYALYAVLLISFGVALTRRRRDDAPMLLYVLATIALYVIFPLTQGTRYIFPILPVFFLFAFQGMKDAAGKLRSNLQLRAVTLVCVLWAALAAASLGASLTDARRNMLEGRQEPSGPFSPAASPMFYFIRNATPADSNIVFFKPRVMRLLTDRDSFLTSNCEDLSKADYVVIAKDRRTPNQISPDHLQDCDASVSLTRVFGKGDFVIYSVSQRP